VPIILYAEFTAKPNSEAEVASLITGLAGKVRQEPGNTEFTVYRKRDNPRKFSSSRSTSMRPVSMPTSLPNTGSSSTSSSVTSSRRARPS
jgi:Antibiotic biosynthesis monooxygenase